MEQIIKLLNQFGFEVPHSMSNERLLLAPEFWKKVVEVTDWWSGYKRFKTTKYDGKGMHYAFEEPYINLWKRFVDHLAEGKDADEFFTKLLK